MMLNIIIAIVSVIVVFTFIFNALIMAIYLCTLNYELAFSTVFLELRCKLKPKIKTVAFLVMMNLQIESELKEILKKKDIDLFLELKKNPRHKEIKLSDVKQMKNKARWKLKNEEEFISFQEVEKILEDAGLTNFWFSLKRTVHRYSSFEQGERYVNSQETKDILNLLSFNKKIADFKSKYYHSSFDHLIRKKSAEYTEQFLWGIN